MSKKRSFETKNFLELLLYEIEKREGSTELSIEVLNRATKDVAE